MRDVNISCESVTTISNTPTVKWSFTIVGSFIVIATIGFNLAVIIRLRLRSKHKYFTKFFITSLAVADILVASTIVPFSVYGLFYDNRRVFGELTCEITNSCDVMFTTTSIFHLTTLSFERFIALYKPLSYNRICNQTMLLVLFLVCWTVPVALSFGLILPRLHLSGLDHIKECMEAQQNSCVFIVNTDYATYSSLVSIFLPIVFIIFFNINICVIIRKQKQVRRHLISTCSLNVNTSRGGFSRETLAAITICVMTLVFLLCWLPFFIFNIISAATLYRISGIILPISTYLGYANSTVNPIVFLSLELRQSIKRNSGSTE